MKGITKLTHGISVESAQKAGSQKGLSLIKNEPSRRSEAAPRLSEKEAFSLVENLAKRIGSNPAQAIKSQANGLEQGKVEELTERAA